MVNFFRVRNISQPRIHRCRKVSRKALGPSVWRDPVQGAMRTRSMCRCGWRNVWRAGGSVDGRLSAQSATDIGKRFAVSHALQARIQRRGANR